MPIGSVITAFSESRSLGTGSVMTTYFAHGSVTASLGWSRSVAPNGNVLFGSVFSTSMENLKTQRSDPCHDMTTTLMMRNRIGIVLSCRRPPHSKTHFVNGFVLSSPDLTLNAKDTGFVPFASYYRLLPHVILFMPLFLYTSMKPTLIIFLFLQLQTSSMPLFILFHPSLHRLHHCVALHSFPPLPFLPLALSFRWWESVIVFRSTSRVDFKDI